jgi:signal transduction histidine kinase
MNGAREPEPAFLIPFRLSPGVAGAVALFLILGIAVWDGLASGEYMLPILYAGAVAMAAWVRSSRFLWGATLLCILLTFTLYLAGERPLSAEARAVVLTNRTLAALAILATALLVQLWVLADRSFRARRLELSRKNDQLEALNQELGQREEEIVRQNEELQSQTEELERQSEELRVVNEDLASREKMMEQLLELSRTLTAELSREEVLKKICEALGLLTGGAATAITEKEGDELVLRCHHGFGPQGPQTSRIPYAQSFSSLIMSVGQTGYLEDVRLRPDLMIPRPAEGEPFASVLSSPLRVRGRCVGTVELYTPSLQTWGQSQITLIESLAAQTSISLQGAELVEAIRQERRRFEVAFRTMPIGVAIADDPEGESVRMNAAAAALLNLPLDENISFSSPAGSRLKRYIFREGRPVVEEDLPLSRALAGVEVLGDELDLIMPMSRAISLLMSAAPIYGGRGEVVGAIVSFVDISAQKGLMREIELRRREAEEASVRKTRFLAAVSHDIRTPANAINLMAEVIHRSAEEPGRSAEIVDLAKKLQANVDSLMELVNDLLDLSRLDTGKVEIQETEFALGEIISEECVNLSPLARDKGIELDCQPLERPIWLRTDRVKLARVLGNLIGNGIKFTQKGGSVRLKVALSPDPHRRVLIRVTDTGLGIAPESLERIFDEFAQLRNPERDSSKGSGLGLSICKRLVGVMGGSILVESAPGKGSTFTVALPASAVALRFDPKLPPEDQSALAPRRLAPLNMRVLLVEDHEVTRDGVRKILVEEGATVEQAADGRTALELVRRGGFEVVLLDMMLPDVDGREVLKEIRALEPAGLKAVVVMTADLTKERVAEVQRLGGCLIAKPVNIRDLLNLLRAL